MQCADEKGSNLQRVKCIVFVYFLFVFYGTELGWRKAIKYQSHWGKKWSLWAGIELVSCSLLCLQWVLSAAGHEASCLAGKAWGVWAGEAWFMEGEVAGNAVRSPCDVLSSTGAPSVLQTVFAFVVLRYCCPGAFQPFQDGDSGIICHQCSNHFLILMVLLMYNSRPFHWSARLVAV